MQRYWGWSTTDYLTCLLTDIYGNFYFWGFPVLGLLLAGLFVFARNAILAPSCPGKFILGLFLLTNILAFEGSADILLFGWIREVPVLILLLVVNPFAVRSNARAGSLRSRGQGYREISAIKQVDSS